MSERGRGEKEARSSKAFTAGFRFRVSSRPGLGVLQIPIPERESIIIEANVMAREEGLANQPGTLLLGVFGAGGAQEVGAAEDGGAVVLAVVVHVPDVRGDVEVLGLLAFLQLALGWEGDCSRGQFWFGRVLRNRHFLGDGSYIQW